MKISLVDVDGHNYPNLALMKLSAWHKAHGDTVDWYSPLFSRPDRIYASKVFTFTPDYFDYSPLDPEPIRGGTGYDARVHLPAEIEAMRPDYSIYPQFREAYGFLSRGCIRRCPWCVVPTKEGKIRAVADIEEIAGDRREVMLMDNNFLANDAAFVRGQLEKIARLKLRVDFNQGLDARLVNEDNVRLLVRVKYIRRMRFACDTSDMLPYIRRAITLIREQGYRGEVFCYALIRDVAEAEYRVRELVNLGVIPFAQPYRDLNTNAEPEKELKIFSRYVNIKGGKMVKKIKFKDYYYGRRDHAST